MEKQKPLEMLKELAIETFKKLDWEKVLYTAYVSTVRPMLEKKVTESESKIDDVIFKGIDKLVETYLGPEQTK